MNACLYQKNPKLYKLVLYKLYKTIISVLIFLGWLTSFLRVLWLPAQPQTGCVKIAPGLFPWGFLILGIPFTSPLGWINCLFLCNKSSPNLAA